MVRSWNLDERKRKITTSCLALFSSLVWFSSSREHFYMHLGQLFTSATKRQQLVTIAVRRQKPYTLCRPKRGVFASGGPIALEWSKILIQHRKMRCSCRSPLPEEDCFHWVTSLRFPTVNKDCLQYFHLCSMIRAPTQVRLRA